MADTQLGALLTDHVSSLASAGVARLGRRAFLAGTAGAVAGATLLSGSAHAVERVELLRGRRATASVRHTCPTRSAGGLRLSTDRWERDQGRHHRPAWCAVRRRGRSAQRDGGQQGCRVELRHDVPGRDANARHVEPEHVAGGRCGCQPGHDQTRQRRSGPELLRRLRPDRRPDRRLPTDVDAGHVGSARGVSVSGACPRHPFWWPTRRRFDFSGESQRVGARGRDRSGRDAHRGRPRVWPDSSRRSHEAHRFRTPRTSTSVSGRPELWV